jgi:hypothetical protein
MKTKVTDQGVLLPKQWFDDVEEVEIRKEQNVILIMLSGFTDPILELGTQPVICDVTDASTNHDHYLYGSAS